MRRGLLAAIVAILPSIAGAATVGEQDGITINRLSANDFEVVSGNFTAVAEYFWCGAATYVVRRKRMSSATPIYIKRPVGPSVTAPGRKGVVFTLSPAGLPAAEERLTLTLDVAGSGMTADKARSYCRDAFTRSTK